MTPDEAVAAMNQPLVTVNGKPAQEMLNGHHVVTVRVANLRALIEAGMAMRQALSIVNPPSAEAWDRALKEATDG